LPTDAEQPLLTPTLIKAARALLDMSQEDLAELVGVSRKTISLIEATKHRPGDPRRIAVILQIEERLAEDKGVEFVFADGRTGEGVRLRRRPSN
jgi:transcriptional regulator with XRE-family HTH domain